MLSRNIGEYGRDYTKLPKGSKGIPMSTPSGLLVTQILTVAQIIRKIPCIIPVPSLFFAFSFPFDSLLLGLHPSILILAHIPLGGNKDSFHIDVRKTVPQKSIKDP